jgi:hypothetical protein
VEVLCGKSAFPLEEVLIPRLEKKCFVSEAARAFKRLLQTGAMWDYGRVLCGKFARLPQKCLHLTLTSVHLSPYRELRARHASVSNPKRSKCAGKNGFF